MYKKVDIYACLKAQILLVNGLKLRILKTDLDLARN